MGLAIHPHPESLPPRKKEKKTSSVLDFKYRTPSGKLIEKSEELLFHKGVKEGTASSTLPRVLLKDSTG